MLKAKRIKEKYSLCRICWVADLCIQRHYELWRAQSTPVPPLLMAIGIPPPTPLCPITQHTQHKTATRVILVSFLVAIGLLVLLRLIVNLNTFKHLEPECKCKISRDTFHIKIIIFQPNHTPPPPTSPVSG
jgi:hypothetical protein